MRILKFGGSSLETTTRIASVVDIIRKARESDELAVVVSACGGVTDDLTTTTRMAANRETGYRELSAKLQDRHEALIGPLVAPPEQEELKAEIRRFFKELHDLLHGVSLVGEFSARTLDCILGYGERLSAAIVAGALRAQNLEARACDAREFILTDDTFGAARVIVDETIARIAAHFRACDTAQVVTGFIAATDSGETTTLGRGGSDLTASLIGAALDAEAIELWTDVNGVMSADPRLVPDARSLESLRYEELMELSHFGAKVIYPPSIHPARSKGIPILIKNTLNPAFPGTAILRDGHQTDQSMRGISSINSVAMLRLEGDGMVGVPGTAMRLFGALAREGISVILITQASSEHSICFAIPPADITRAKLRIDEEFALERSAGLIDELVIEDELAIIAAVGDQMRERPGVAGQLFNVLGDAGINVRAIAQGSSELNISLVVAREDEHRALNAIHDTFFVRLRPAVHVCVVGTGNVGGTLIDQLIRQSAAVETHYGRQLILRTILNRRTMLRDESGISDLHWRDHLGTDSHATPSDLPRAIAQLQAARGTRILVDCTAGDEVSPYFRDLLEAGVSVVTANKRPLTGPWDRCQELFGRYRDRFYAEATVGAGLPVIGTLQSLIDTGDRIDRIEGVLSGTIAYLMHRLRAGETFSTALRRAHDLGYTEPDPREDLAGVDIARKLLILSRFCGCRLEMDDVSIEPLLRNESQRGGTVEEFMAHLEVHDDYFAERTQRCRDQETTLTYLAQFAASSANLTLTEVDQTHPAARTTGTDNLIAFYTERYRDTPLVIQGPGAGPAVTAAGVMSNILTAIRQSESRISQPITPNREHE